MSACVLIADYNDDAGISAIRDMFQKAAHVHVVQKGTPSKPKGCTTELLRNNGREQHTYLHFICKNYDNLPDHMLFTPSRIDWRHRRDFLRSLVDIGWPKVDKSFFKCDGGGSTLHDANAKDFTLDVYQDTPVLQAGIRPLYKWAEHFIDDWGRIKDHACCYWGIVATTRSNIRSKPLSFYERLLEEFKVDSTHHEAVHFMERLDAVIFGRITS